MTCDIGIVSYGSFHLLEKCLESIFGMEKPLPGRVMVFENGPEDVPSSIKRNFQQVLFHKNQTNLGFSKACNQILKTSKADYVCLLNPDTRLRRPFLSDAVDWLEEHRDVAVLGPKIVDPDGAVQGSARGFPGIATAFFGRTTFLTRLLPDNPVTRKNIQTHVSGSAPVEVDWVSGACMVVRMAAVNHVGYLDEKFFMYWEDCDWCTRFWQKGWKVVYHPGIGPIEHKAGSTSQSVRLKSLYWFHKSAVRLYCKYDNSPLSIGSVIAVAGGAIRFMILLPKAVFSRS